MFPAPPDDFRQAGQFVRQVMSMSMVMNGLTKYFVSGDDSAQPDSG